MFHVLLCKVFSSLWRRESWTEENSKRWSPGGIHQIESTLILQPSRYCQYSRVLFCMHVFAPAQSHCTNKQTNKQTTCHSCPEKRMHWACTITCTNKQTIIHWPEKRILLQFGPSQWHAQADKQPALPWEAFSFDLDLHNHLHKQTNNPHCPEKRILVQVFAMTIRSFSLWRLCESYVKAALGDKPIILPQSSLHCTPQKKPSKNRRMKECGRVVKGNGGD